MSVFVVSCAVVLTVSSGLSSVARPGDADTQMQVQIDELTAKIKANPRDTKSLSARGVAYWKSGNLLLSEADAEKLISTLPNSPFGYWLKAMIAKERKDHSAGLKFIRECIKREPFEPNHIHYEMSCLRDLKRFSELFELTNRLETKSPTDPEVFYFRAFARAGLDQSNLLVKNDLVKSRKLAVASKDSNLVSDIDAVINQLK